MVKRIRRIERKKDEEEEKNRDRFEEKDRKKEQQERIVKVKGIEVREWEKRK